MITIKTQKRFTVSDGRSFDTLREAKDSELHLLLDKCGGESAAGIDFRNALIASLLDDSDKVVDILTMTERSLPKARAINGATKKRKPKDNLPAQPSNA